MEYIDIPFLVFKLFITIIYGVLVSFISIKLFDILTKDIDEMEEISKGNVSVAIYLSSILLGFAILISKTVSQSLMIKSNIIDLVFIDLIKFLIASVIGILSIFISIQIMKFLLKINKINLTEGLKSRNISLALLVGIYIIVVSILIENSLYEITSVVLRMI